MRRLMRKALIFSVTVRILFGSLMRRLMRQFSLESHVSLMGQRVSFKRHDDLMTRILAHETSRETVEILAFAKQLSGKILMRGAPRRLTTNIDDFSVAINILFPQ